MPKPLLFKPQQIQKSEQQSENRLSATLKPKDNQDLRTNPIEIQRALRKRRSTKYMEIMSKLDAGSGHISQHDINEMIQAIRDEFPDIEIVNEFLGSMAICHLPGNYDVHTLNPGDNSITHFHMGYSFEAPLDKCRNLCRMPDYLFVEIYSNQLRAISPNGAVANIDAPGAGEAWKRLQSQPTTLMYGPCEGFL